MSQNQKPTHTMPGGAQEENSKADDGVVNDSLGTVDTADTTGTGEENQPCEKPEKSSRNSQGIRLASRITSSRLFIAYG